MITTYSVLNLATQKLDRLKGNIFNTVDLAKPTSADAAINLTKIVSKLSPMMGNLIEFNICEYLNTIPEFTSFGHWKRQDPGFPDTIFESRLVSPTPGIEIKAWFPLSTEITARFKDSQDHFQEDQTNVALVAWLPQFLIFGKPQIIDVSVMSAKSVAAARDAHYSNPPDYLIVEPGDTSDRTLNLQQTNTNGYKFQGTQLEFIEAQNIYTHWCRQNDMNAYSTDMAYQLMVQELMSKFKYRLDTNFAKMDRIDHHQIEAFKTRVLNSIFHGRSIYSWSRLLSKGRVDEIKQAISSTFNINY